MKIRPQARMNSFKAALRGVTTALRYEVNFQLEIILAVLAIVLATLFSLGRIEWLILIVTIFVVLSFELVNTGFERLADIRMPRIDPAVKVAKDVSAAAVLIASLGALVVGIILFGPPLWNLFVILK